ncbi:hypothetical protein [Maritimibacter sp. UBA3975]|uniref:hypothetical protein n=1 Tax=Maritimibacter sp. UBA3975 TaxID=1946833 RepID=UPI000C098CEF|nr:hypothetical protein [Maritimibacter sp. UBA3975]MAM60843.1 hypothetical protein [Maritimibacter sp.]|tara:strand:- start:415 stop:639 length:225 start_codon:yes stop_codon:yes gene_type:complete
MTIKAMPVSDFNPAEHQGRAVIVLDEAGKDLFNRVLKRCTPLRTDDPKGFNAALSDVSGSLIAASHQMGWRWPQ